VCALLSTTTRECARLPVIWRFVSKGFARLCALVTGFVYGMFSRCSHGLVKIGF
jgi:hypothetical protein